MGGSRDCALWTNINTDLRAQRKTTNHQKSLALTLDNRIFILSSEFLSTHYKTMCFVLRMVPIATQVNTNCQSAQAGCLRTLWEPNIYHTELRFTQVLDGSQFPHNAKHQYLRTDIQQLHQLHHRLAICLCTDGP